MRISEEVRLITNARSDAAYLGRKTFLSSPQIQPVTRRIAMRNMGFMKKCWKSLTIMAMLETKPARQMQAHKMLSM